MEFARRGHLSKSDNLLSVDFERRIKIARAIAEGMNILHIQNPPVLHRRLKPNNVLLTRDFKVKLSDYGRVAAPQLSDIDFLSYSAPEVLEGKPHTKESDVFSYGMTLFCLFYKQAPYSEGADQIKALVLGGKRPTLDDTHQPTLLNAFIRQCWDATPTNRPSFTDILQKQRPWSSWLIEMNSLQKGDATKVWDAANGADQLKWVDFSAAWSKQFLKGKDPIFLKCLQVLLDADDKNAIVSKAKFDRFLDWFGPVKGDTIVGLSKFIPAIFNTSNGWFHGCITTHDAKEHLRAGSRELGYLVRLNTFTDEKKRDSFILAYRKDKKTHEVFFSFKFDNPASPKDQVEALLKSKSLADLAAMPVSEGRSARFEKATSTKQAHSGSGYVVELGTLAGFDTKTD